MLTALGLLAVLLVSLVITRTRTARLLKQLHTVGGQVDNQELNGYVFASRITDLRDRLETLERMARVSESQAGPVIQMVNEMHDKQAALERYLKVKYVPGDVSATLHVTEDHYTKTTKKEGK